MKRLLMVCSAVLLVVADYPAEDSPGKKELDKLQGTWSYVWHIDPNGEKMSDDQLQKMTITYTGDKWTVYEQDRELVSGTQRLDPSKTPHEIDSLLKSGEGKGTTMLGIYKFHEDTFQVCFDPQGKERPKDFTPKKGQFAGLIKRQKK
jgi:uncharacterized protein (TIGR03067 family)